MFSSSVFLMVAAAIWFASGDTHDTGIQWMHDPGFEDLTAGDLAVTGEVTTGWEIQRVCRASVADRLAVTCVKNETRAKSGRQCLALSIPADTVGFEYVTVGQRLQLVNGRDYEASVWARWPAGPDAAPAGASPTSGHPSAILSLWARHRNGTGDFAGRDEWLFDNHWHRLAFRFRVTDPQQRTFVYASLLPNQQPATTTVLLDDFQLREQAGGTGRESRTGNIVSDGGFDRQQTGPIAPPWRTAQMGGSSITCHVVESDGQRCVTIIMGKATSSLESVQLSQELDLEFGVCYHVSCRMRWDNFRSDAPQPIVNYGMYHEESRSWFGPIDQVLERCGDWHTYRFTHIPPTAGAWRLYVQLNGWGNVGRAVAISVDDFSCTQVPTVPSAE